jgi:hypothetical protein
MAFPFPWLEIVSSGYFCRAHRDSRDFLCSHSQMFAASDCVAVRPEVTVLVILSSHGGKGTALLSSGFKCFSGEI